MLIAKTTEGNWNDICQIFGHCTGADADAPCQRDAAPLLQHTPEARRHQRQGSHCSNFCRRIRDAFTRRGGGCVAQRLCGLEHAEHLGDHREPERGGGLHRTRGVHVAEARCGVGPVGGASEDSGETLVGRRSTPGAVEPARGHVAVGRSPGVVVADQVGGDDHLPLDTPRLLGLLASTTHPVLAAHDQQRDAGRVDPGTIAVHLAQLPRDP
mmetsp:Transcript_121414/g.329751  ORF Transcript_121414/g.329751 Transcript_121414/m.329751 type:complete len:212 (-) Transcript_121414:1354-1989(-)